MDDEPLPVALMNTIWADHNGVHDTLDTHTADWLWAAAGTLLADVPDNGAGPETGGPRTVDRLRRLRDALRRLAAGLTDDDRPTAASAITDRQAALTVLNETCALAPAWSELVWPDDAAPHTVVRTKHAPSALALARLAEQAVDMFARPSTLGACGAPGCVRYFVRDHPRREWCSSACGNRARVARHYRRHHGRTEG